MPASIRPWVAFVPYTVVSVVHVVAQLLELPADAPTKLMLMPALALAAVWTTAKFRPWPRGERILLLAAILFSWLGDGASAFFPMFEDPLPMMLLCFGLAHVGYMLLMLRGRGLRVRRFPLWALVYVLAYGSLMALLLPHTGSLTVPVVVYGLLLVGTAAGASLCGAAVAWGGAWFLASDAILAFRIFVPEAMPDWTSGLVMLTYTLGQGLIVFGITAALQRRARQPESRSTRKSREAPAAAC